jgi:hypothetical protein
LRSKFEGDIDISVIRERESKRGARTFIAACKRLHD